VRLTAYGRNLIAPQSHAESVLAVYQMTASNHSTLPPVHADYLRDVRKVGEVLYTPGVLPFWGEEMRHTSESVRPRLRASEAAARLCVRQLVVLLREELGNLDRVDQVTRLNILVRGSEGSRNLSRIADSASVEMVAIFGKRGRHLREVVATGDLPGGAPVQLSAVVRFH
jgi:hypothetical protein